MISDQEVRDAFHLVNRQGFAAIALQPDKWNKLAEPLYQSMDSTPLHPNRKKYYNEVSFFWPEDWRDVENGIGSFHDPSTVREIFAAEDARILLSRTLSPDLCDAVFDFSETINHLITANHHGLPNCELKLSRVMIRQMNERHQTDHAGSNFHEDIGYSDRPYQQLVSVVLTTFGIPTEAKKYSAGVGELLIFNAFDRRRILGLTEDFAFIHRGPKSGPKMFFFFEFLGPKDSKLQTRLERRA
jgi:hypothetical protein